MTLVEFLTARLDEDEAAARAAIKDDGGETGGFEDAFDALTGRTGSPLDFSPRFGDAAAQMIVRFTPPARVLREVEAKRAIVARCATIAGDLVPCAALADGVLRHLAAVYADHPDYREEWRP